MQITLKSARINAGYTQKQVAKILGKAEATIVSWEKDWTSMKLYDALELCKLYKISLNDIFLPNNLGNT